MSEISEVVGGGTPDSKRSEYWGGDVAWITPADLSGYHTKTIACGARSITQSGLANSGARVLPSGAVLMSSRAPVGYVAIAAQPLTTSQGFKSFVLGDAVLAEYVYWFLKGNSDLLREYASGTTFAEVSGRRAGEIPIPIPPLAEQHRIVAALEERLTDIDAAVAALQRARANVKRYRVSVMLEGTRPGSLFGPENAHWELSRIGEIFRVSIGSTPSRSNATYWNGNIPWVSSGEVAFSRIRATRESISELGLANSSTKMCAPGTVLIGMIGEGKTRGQVAILDVAACTNQNSAAIHVSETDHCPEFLFYALAAQYDATRRIGGGNNQKALNKQRVSELQIGMPDPQIQRLIVSQIEERLLVADRTLVDIDRQLGRAARLRQALMQRAFTGHLVVQQQTDEPAALRLERARPQSTPVLRQTPRGLTTRSRT